MKQLNIEEYSHIGTLVSNFDHVIDREIEALLVNQKNYADYPGWNFHGKVWYQNGEFHCEVKLYRSHVDTISANTTDELMNRVSNCYGWD